MNSDPDKGSMVLNVVACDFPAEVLTTTYFDLLLVASARIVHATGDIVVRNVAIAHVVGHQQDEVWFGARSRLHSKIGDAKSHWHSWATVGMVVISWICTRMSDGDQRGADRQD